MKNIYLILTLILSACMQKSTIPKATKKPYEMTEHGNTRIDNYYWMRLTDDQKSAKKYDNQTAEVVEYIEDENSYLESNLSHTKNFQNDLFEEIVGRIEKDDESVPYFDNGYFYYSRNAYWNNGCGMWNRNGTWIHNICQNHKNAISGQFSLGSYL